MWLGGGCTVISGRVEIRFQAKSSSPRVEVVFLQRLGFVQSALSLIWGDLCLMCESKEMFKRNILKHKNTTISKIFK